MLYIPNIGKDETTKSSKHARFRAYDKTEDFRRSISAFLSDPQSCHCGQMYFFSVTIITFVERYFSVCGYPAGNKTPFSGVAGTVRKIWYM